MNNKLIAGVVAIVALLAIGAAIAQGWLMDGDDSSEATSDTSSQTTTPEQAAIHEEYPKLPENNRFVRESADQTVARYQEGTGVIFLGFKECPWCQQMAPLLNEAAEAEGMNIYYLDIRKERADNTPHYRQLVSILTPHLEKDENGNPRISVPDVSFVKNGEIVWRFEMDATTEDERTPEAYWTEDRKARAVATFRDQMQNLK